MKKPSDKGSAFERDICKLLSLWMSQGARPDIFFRNPASGGAFTLSLARGRALGFGGDVAAGHPLAHSFLEHFYVEAKHWKTLGLETLLLGRGGDFLAITKNAENQAKQVGRHFMIVAKQNFRPTLLVMPSAIGMRLLGHQVSVHHTLCNGTYFATLFADMLKVDPVVFMDTIASSRRFGRPKGDNNEVAHL
jgi:hypothetical protein